jgi:hypothetical protein
MDSPLKVKDVQDIIDNKLRSFTMDHIENKFIEYFKENVQLRRYHKLISNINITEDKSTSQILQSLK